MDIYLTNNLTNKKEQFIPKNKNNVGMYVCGPTVYDDPHIGNARPLICLLYTSPSPRDLSTSRMPSSA